MVVSKQLALCQTLLQAVQTCKQQCAELVPSAFNSALLEDLQQLVQQAASLEDQQQLQGIRACLEASLQLLSRVSSLGPIEAFFVSDELLTHYQYRLDTTQALLGRLCQHSNTSSQGSQQEQPHNSSSSSSSPRKLQLPEQQQRIVQGFRQQAAKVCPLLVQSCPPEALQQLCDTVKQGLVLVNGHSFLIGQEWHAEVSAMLARAEQLKVLLAHLQAHHLSLLAAVLQLLHQQEVQEFDQPHTNSINSPSLRSSTPAGLLLYQQQHHYQQQQQQHGSAPGLIDQQHSDAGSAALGQQQLSKQVPAQVLVMAGFDPPVASVSGGVRPEAAAEQQEQEEDEFFMPVAPLVSAAAAGGSSPVAHATAAAAGGGGPPALPFHIPRLETRQHSSSVQSHDGDSLARTPSSGCSSLMEYVQHSMTLQHCPASAASRTSPGGSPSSGAYHHSLHQDHQQQQQHQQHAAVLDLEQQLLCIGGSPEVAAVLAVALGLDQQQQQQQQPCSRVTSSSSSYWSALSVGSSPTATTAATTAAAAATGSSLFTSLVAAREHSVCSGRSSSPANSRPPSVLGTGRLLTTSASQQQQAEALPLSSVHGSGGGGNMARQHQLHHQHHNHQQQPRWRWRRTQGQTRSSRTTTLCLKDVQLPPGCCKSIGAVCYLSPLIKRVVLVGVGLTDQAVGELVDALKVNSSVQHLDLSSNQLDDIGARVLAILLRPSAGCSSSLRTLCLQHNQIGDDGAAALACGLGSGSRLRRLWLQHNVIGEAGAQALCNAMQHNTACIDLKLQPGNAGMPTQLAQTAQQLAKQNRGAQDHIKGMLKVMMGK